MDESIALEALKRVKDILDFYNIEFWLDCGTLLGAARNGKIIKWDHDIDLGTWQDNTFKICQAFKQFRNKGFRICSYDRYVVRIEMRNIPISIIMYSLENDYAKINWGSNCISPLLRKFFGSIFWAFLSPHYTKVKFNVASNIKEIICLILSRFCRITPICLKKWAKKMEYKWGAKFVWIIPADYFSHLSTIKFYGIEFKIPAKTVEYLIYRYGEGWRYPNKEWVTAENDGAVFNARKYFEENLCVEK